MAFHAKLLPAFCAGLLAMAAPISGRAEPPPPSNGAPVLNADAPPYLTVAGRRDYVRFLQQATPRAFALSPDGSWGWAAALDTPKATEARAIEICAGWGGQGCRVYARDLQVVWPGRESGPPPVREAVLSSGPGWSLAADERFLWQGPGAARGAYLWAHGRAAGGQDSRGGQPQPHVRIFNNAGYDVLRFDRAPATDETDAAAAWMRSALSELRAQGYAKIVVGGQSRGAWNALQALDRPGLADAVVAVAPAAHGATGSAAWAWALDDLRQVVKAARSPQARVAVANFAGDEFDPDPDGRAQIFRSLQAPRQVGALLFLDRPQGLEGHGAGADARFTQRFGACLLDFAEGRASRC
jgi:dienelactone hydrolase